MVVEIKNIIVIIIYLTEANVIVQSDTIADNTYKYYACTIYNNY